MEQGTREKIYLAVAGVVVALTGTLLDLRAKNRTEQTLLTTLAVYEAQNVFRDREIEELKKVTKERAEIISDFRAWRGEKNGKDIEHENRINRLDARVTNLENKK